MYDHNKSRMAGGRAVQQTGIPHLRWSNNQQRIDTTVHELQRDGIYTMIRIGKMHKVVLSSNYDNVQVSGSFEYVRGWWSMNVCGYGA